MKVAGFGFRKGAGIESLMQALVAAGGPNGIERIATVSVKAEAPCFLELAQRLGLPLQSVGQDALSHATVATQSEKSLAMYGTGSLSEAVALLAAGPNARLVTPRVISHDSMATCAIAEVSE